MQTLAVTVQHSLFYLFYCLIIEFHIFLPLLVLTCSPDYIILLI